MIEEHVLGPAEADALGAERDGLGRLVGQVRVGADAELAELVRPFHQLGVLLVDLRLLRLERFLDQHLHDLARPRRRLAGEDFAGEAVEADPVAVLEHLVADADRALGVVDVESAAADDADLAHLPADQGRMAGGAAERGQNALGGLHAAQILRARLPADEDDPAIGLALVLIDKGLGVLGMELDPARRRSRAGVDPLGEQLAFLDRDTLRFGIEDRLQELVQVVGRDTPDREGLLLGDEPFLHHVDGEADGGKPGALAVARLQHPELLLLHGELDVLHVAVVLLQLGRGSLQAAGRPRACPCPARRSSWACGCRRRRPRPGR